MKHSNTLKHLFVAAFKIGCIFAGNMTRHASHQNCAPGRVFEFYAVDMKGVPA